MTAFWMDFPEVENSFAPSLFKLLGAYFVQDLNNAVAVRMKSLFMFYVGVLGFSKLARFFFHVTCQVGEKRV